MILATFSVLLNLTLVTVLFSRPAEAVKCFQCQSESEKFCVDPFNKNVTSLRICDGTFCLKSIGTESGSTLISRMCSDAAIFKISCETIKLGSASQTVCTCATDLCNGSNIGQRSALVIILSSITVLGMGGVF